MIIPPKLKSWDEIRVIAPSQSFAIISSEVRSVALQRFKELWIKVSFGKNVEKIDQFLSSSVQDRIEDLHEAFADKNVKWIFTAIWWYNSHQILDYIDYDLISNNPKILCWYSDITALCNAITAKTWIITYSWPHFSTFGMKKYFDYTMEYFKKCIIQEWNFSIRPSDIYTDDERYIDQENRKVFENNGYVIINPRQAQWKIIWWNSSSFGLLRGTQYMPDLQDSVIFLEDDNVTWNNFCDFINRDLQALIHQKNFDKVRWLLIWRSQTSTDFSIERLKAIIHSKKELDNIPVIANLDFGHTFPLITFPIWWEISIEALNNNVSIKILTH